MNTYKLLTQLTFLHDNHAFAAKAVSKKEFDKYYTPLVTVHIIISKN